MSKVTFTCSKCQTYCEVDADDFDTDSESEESGMGTKTEHWTYIETECQNKKCGNSISITINQTEYPTDDFHRPEVNTYSGADNIIIH